jgi:hypothetical protein
LEEVKRVMSVLIEDRTHVEDVVILDVKRSRKPATWNIKVHRTAQMSNAALWPVTYS